jgi:hypothetical protein
MIDQLNQLRNDPLKIEPILNKRKSYFSKQD